MEQWVVREAKSSAPTPGACPVHLQIYDAYPAPPARSLRVEAESAKDAYPQAAFEDGAGLDGLRPCGLYRREGRKGEAEQEKRSAGRESERLHEFKIRRVLRL